VRVQHRQIIYVQGYDPRGLAQYYRMFRTELRKFSRLYQIAASISRPQSTPDGETASWTIETKAADWQTRTSYDFLRFEDLIQRDLAAPIWHTVFHAVLIYWRLVFSGTIARFWKAHWRFATFVTYPHFLLLIEALGVFGIAYGFGKGLQALGILRESGHEHFNGSIVIPIFSCEGDVLGMYGRKITPNLREGTPLHLYLPGPHRGVFNEQAVRASKETPRKLSFRSTYSHRSSDQTE